MILPNFEFPENDNFFISSKETLLKACGSIRYSKRANHIICLILILKKLRLLKSSCPERLYSPEIFLDLANELRERLDEESSMFLEFLIDNLERFHLDLKELGSDVICDVLEMVDSLNSKYVEEKCGLLFEFLLKHIQDGEGKRSSVDSQPIELTELIMSLCPEKTLRVYNPFSGFSSAALFLPSDVSYYPQEINAATREFAFLRLFAHGLHDSVHYHIPKDSIHDWLDPIIGGYQFIVSTPPFGMRLDRNLDIESSQRSVEAFCLEKSLESLHECSTKSKAVITVPLGVLFRGGQERFLREKLIKSDLLESIILLPGSLFTNTSIPVALVVLNRDKKHKKLFQMVDASECFTKLSAKKRVLNVKAVRELLEIENEFSRLVTAEELESNEFDLSAKRYLLDYSFEEDDVNVVKLNKILTPSEAPSVKPTDKEIGTYVNIKHLATDPFKYAKSFDDIEETEIKSGMQKISHKCLLLLLVHKPLRPTFFDAASGSIYISRDIVACTLNEELVDLEYLIHELSKDYIQNQISNFAIGTAMMRISRKDLFSLKVKLPSPIEQKAIVKGLKQGHVSSKLEEAKQTAKELEVDGKAFDQLASLKHSMGKPLLNLNSSIKIISKAISKISDSGEQVTLQSKVSNRSDLSIRDAFDNMVNDLRLIGNLLENSENEFDPSTYSLESIEMCSILKSFLRTVKTSDGNFTTTLEFSDIIANEFKSKVFVKANKDLLFILFNNIVDNAIRHGFIEDSQDTYRLSIDVDIDDKNLIILFSNNGVPFPKNFDITKFVRKHVKSEVTGNTWLGGFDINNIVNHLGGQFNLDLNNPNEVFSTIYVITLPIEAAE